MSKLGRKLVTAAHEGVAMAQNRHDWTAENERQCRIAQCRAAQHALSADYWRGKGLMYTAVNAQDRAARAHRDAALLLRKLLRGT